MPFAELCSDPCRMHWLPESTRLNTTLPSKLHFFYSEYTPCHIDGVGILKVVRCSPEIHTSPGVPLTWSGPFWGLDSAVPGLRLFSHLPGLRVVFISNVAAFESFLRGPQVEK